MNKPNIDQVIDKLVLAAEAADWLVKNSDYKLEGEDLNRYHVAQNHLNEKIGLLKRQVFIKPDKFLTDRR